MSLQLKKVNELLNNEASPFQHIFHLFIGNVLRSLFTLRVIKLRVINHLRDTNSEEDEFPDNMLKTNCCLNSYTFKLTNESL